MRLNASSVLDTTSTFAEEPSASESATRRQASQLSTSESAAETRVGGTKKDDAGAEELGEASEENDASRLDGASVLSCRRCAGVSLPSLRTASRRCTVSPATLSSLFLSSFSDSSAATGGLLLVSSAAAREMCSMGRQPSQQPLLLPASTHSPRAGER